MKVGNKKIGVKFGKKVDMEKKEKKRKVKIGCLIKNIVKLDEIKIEGKKSKEMIERIEKDMGGGVKKNGMGIEKGWGKKLRMMEFEKWGNIEKMRKDWRMDLRKEIL